MGVYAGIRRIPTSDVFWQRILTSFVIIKQGIRGYTHWRRCLYADKADTANAVALFGRSVNIFLPVLKQSSLEVSFVSPQ